MAFRRQVRQWTQQTRSFTVLAMESSADDTAVAIVDGARKQILSNIIMKQHAHHQVFGGIHPSIAIQWHQRNLPFAVKLALKKANMDVQNVDGIAFTRGPGMGGCLSVGVNAAKTLAAALNKPIVGVHHMQAHALTPELTNPGDFSGYPFLTLLISGGHTMIVLALSRQKFKILASSVDVAIGNAFDKVARMLGIAPDPSRGYGAALEAVCNEQHPSENVPSLPNHPFPPLAYNLPNRLQPEIFSFTGLIAAVQRMVHSQQLDDHRRWVVARAFQNAAFSQLELKLKGALDWCDGSDTEIKSLVVSGGVASNLSLRQRLQDSWAKQPRETWHLIFPPPEFCTDNAVMIAWASMHRFRSGDFDDYGVLPLSTWSIEDLNASTP